MKFVDEATIRVIAGKGGNGCLSFLREKFRPNGGPDGGDGGNGGSIYLVAKSGLNTLADFRFIRQYRAKNGAGGAGKDRFGKKGDDLLIAVPLGTIVSDAQTNEIIGDVTKAGERLLVAEGGRRGLGNANFKSSTNRAPRRTTPGKMGDERLMKLELKVLADVGLLGLPNAGKSTLLSAVSHARPKIADYPFTTLHPQLGVVDIGHSSSFVIADIPGLIEGAAQGTGLGIQFLKHLKRTRILLHLVDIAPIDHKDLEQGVREIERELSHFEPSLADKERWLVLNKIDTVSQEMALEIESELKEKLSYRGQVYRISALTGAGCDKLTNDVMNRLLRIDEAIKAELENRESGAQDLDRVWDQVLQQ
ncbi:Obg family GTPase CgtA [Candidatus Spongiihabitans sp.]|uniref:Obg family GTPase CgtA n=1 Tax=Candidatus Spongiihabitans sp. TaxID=3101308 RepID=UPI003C7ED9D9